MRTNPKGGRARRTAAALGVFAAILAIPEAALAADVYVARPITLPRFDWAFDFGLGIAHADRGGRFQNSYTGPGLNFEMAVGITSAIELGFRGGVRLNNDGRFIRADNYGRLYDTVTFGTGGDTFSNPEFRITGAIVHAQVVEIALEGRVLLPFEAGTRFGGLFGVPFLFHIPPIMRLDLGFYLGDFFYDPNYPFFVIPARFWFQVSDRVWLGPITQLTHVPATNTANFLLGFGLGVQLHRIVDFKTQFYFPAINEAQGARDFGVGAGVQIRIE
jgi:hypothetical protein